jgi:hypothetical protein
MSLLVGLLGLQLVGAGPLVVARNPGPRPVTKTEVVKTMTDTLRAGPAGARRARTVRPGTAVLLSALIPGGGQFYTGNLLKGVLLGVCELSLAGLSLREHLEASRAAPEQRAAHEDSRNTFLFWTGFVWGYSLADAYVSAHMYGFKEEQRLDVRASPGALWLAYRF